MNNYNASFLSLLGIFLLTAVFHDLVEAQELKSPGAFLGYEMGERLTPHHRVVSYFEHVASYSDRVELSHYGKTYGGRELLVAYVSSPENLSRLEEIRTNNLRRAGLEQGDPTGLEDRAIIWLSYNVHGNEISATEASLFTLYDLARDTHPESGEWLDNTVVIIDPLLNPDGRDRYVNWYHQVAGKNPDPYPGSREHLEPWPNARTNYYQFDLNRDWAWQTQIETQQRMALYHSWMPHIHADFHEMGVDAPYYFAPAAEPFHESITDWQREFQTTIGKNHIRYFDENFRVYFTRERFDLFYPSYGDTYPTYNGAIGMTYEQAGNTRGGLSVITAEGDTLTFERRILNQHVVGMSTVEVTSAHFERVAEEFYRFFSEGKQAPYAPWKSYIISGDNNPDHLELLASYLDAWDIKYGRAPSGTRVQAYDYQSKETRRIELGQEDLLISAYQPKSLLLNVLFEPQTTIVDSLTYDITAWSVPYAMGLRAFASEQRIEPAGNWSPPTTEPDFTETPDKPYAYLATWESKQDAYFLSQLLQNNIRVRFASRPFSMHDGSRYERGTLIIARRGNEHLGSRFDETVRELATELNRNVRAVETGFVDAGQDFGSPGVNMIHPPKVGLMSGRGVNPNNFGEIWHFLDRQIDYPVSVLEHARVGMADLRDFDILVFPEGNYLEHIPDRERERIARWVYDGGKLISFGDAASGLYTGFPEQQKRPEPEAEPEKERQNRLLRHEDRQRAAASRMITGSIYYVHLDNSHPLAFGYPEYYYTLKRGSDAFIFLENGNNVGTLRRGAHRAGFEGAEVKDHILDTVVFGKQNFGSGSIVYLNDNPLFRAFWHNGALIFANALFLAGQD